jgi:hypothetical protein
MEELVNNGVALDAERKRSSSYPIKELSYIISFVTKIYTDLGFNKYHPNTDIAKVNDLAVASTKQILSTAQQYNLLEIKHGTGYKVTNLFIKIHKPVNEHEKKNAIAESLKSPEIFSKLINEYVGHPVPLQSGLTNQISRNFDLKENIAEKVAEIFTTNLREFGFLNSRNELILDDTSKGAGVKKDEVVEPKKEPPFVPVKEDENFIDIPIPLKSTKQKARLILPETYTEEDLDRIAKFVEALK